MKSLSILCYIIGSILLIVSCFTTGVTVTWILGGVAVLFLIAGCIFQYNTTKQQAAARRQNVHRT
jgi:lipoprotein